MKFLSAFAVVLFLLYFHPIFSIPAYGLDISTDPFIKCGTPEAVDNYFSGVQKIAARYSYLVNLNKSVLSAAGHFRVHYDTTGFHAPDSADVDKNGIPDYVDSTMAYFEYAWDMEVNQLGFLEPLPDNGTGGGTEIDVYIYNGTNSYGATYPEATTGGYSGYIVIDNNFAESQYATHGYAALRVTSAHEFFHVIHFRYKYDMRDLHWWMEQSAVWMENYVWDDVNDYLAYLKYFFQDKSSPLDSNNGNFMYGAVVWPMYLTKKYGDGVIKDIWEYISETGFYKISTLSPVFPSGYQSDFSEFSVWNFFTGINANTEQFYPDGDLFGYTVSIDSKVSSFPADKQITGLDYLTTRYVELLFSDTCSDCNSLSITVEPTGETESRPSLILFSSPQNYVIYDNLGTGTKTVQYNNTLDKGYLVLPSTNSSTGSYGFNYSMELSTGVNSGTPLYQFAVTGAYPNPFNPITQIRFNLPGESNVKLYAYNLAGQKVADIYEGFLSAGEKSVFWKPGNMASGIYIVRVNSRYGNETTKVMFLK